MLARVFLLVAFFLVACATGMEGEEHHEIAVKLPDGANADEVAARYGYHNKGQIGSLEGYYLFELQEEHKAKRDVAVEKADTLMGAAEIQWAEKQVPKVNV